MINETELYSPLHEAYCSHSGQRLFLTIGRIFAWSEWKLRGWTQGDLVAVINLVKKRIEEKRKWPSALHFRNLIENLDEFEEMLAEARSMDRAFKVDSGKARVLHATGRSVEPKIDATKSAGDVMRGNAALRELLNLRDSL